MAGLLARLRRILAASHDITPDPDLVAQVKTRYEDALMALDGVVSVGVGQGVGGSQTIVVGVRSEAVRQALALPRSLEGFAVTVTVLGTPSATSDALS